MPPAIIRVSSIYDLTIKLFLCSVILRCIRSSTWFSLLLTLLIIVFHFKSKITLALSGQSRDPIQIPSKSGPRVQTCHLVLWLGDALGFYSCHFYFFKGLKSQGHYCLFLILARNRKPNKFITTASNHHLVTCQLNFGFVRLSCRHEVDMENHPWRMSAVFFHRRGQIFLYSIFFSSRESKWIYLRNFFSLGRKQPTTKSRFPRKVSGKKSFFCQRWKIK